MTKKILFTGISPYGNFVYADKPYSNGDEVAMDDATAEAVVKAYLGVEIDADPEFAQKAKVSIAKANKTRAEILSKKTR